jgi:hypothetical protein
MTQHQTPDALTPAAPTSDAAAAPAERVHRRTALRAGAVGVAAAAAAVVATSTSAQAAPGQPVVQGANNVAGSATTFLTTSGATATLQVRNNGVGAAAFFFSQSGNGFAGGTGSPSRYGLSAANTGGAGTGAGMAASGGNNSGILANTANADRFAVRATNAATAEGSGGAVIAEGGQGVGAVALTENPGVAALVVGGATVSFGDTVLGDGFLAVTVTPSAVELYGVVSAERPAVTLAGNVTLTAGGGATFNLPADLVADADMADASVVVTPRSGSMPNLFASVSAAGVVTISGGAASGTVGYQVTVHQPLLQQLGQSTGAGGTVLGRARAVVEAARG